jgi:hypothetical protein
MALLFGGTGGGVFISSVVSEEVYDPIYDTNMDAAYLYSIIGSYYRDLMSDQDIFAVTWSGLMQAVSGDLLHAWTVDYAKSLRDVPVISQRKWVQLNLVAEEDFEVDPGLLSQGVGSKKIVYSEAGSSLTGSWSSRARWDKQYVNLRGMANEETSLSFSATFQIFSLDPRGVALIGYMGDGLRLQDSLMAYVYGQPGTGVPSYGIAHFSGLGRPTITSSTHALTIGAVYRFEFTYTAKTGVAVLGVVDTKSRRVSGVGSTLGASADIFVNQFYDADVNFDTLGVIPGDLLGVVAREFTITSVDGSTLTLREIALPADAFDLPYTIVGEYTVSSVSLDIPGDAAVPTFTAAQFGTSMLDTRAYSTAFFAGTAVGVTRKKVSLSILNWSYMDPTLDEEIISLPRLQDVITDPQALLFEGTDYRIQRVDRLRMRFVSLPTGIAVGELIVGAATGSVAAIQSIGANSLVATLRGGDFTVNEDIIFEDLSERSLTSIIVDPDSTLYFQEPPTGKLWAEYVGYDERYTQNNFGVNVDLSGPSTDQYKARVRGLYYSYFRGPNVNDIRRGIHILIGLPIAEAGGTVDSINLSYSGSLGVITVGEAEYLFPLLVGTSLQVGDVVNTFDPLCNGVEVSDYLKDPEWFVNVGIDELLKYHTFLVRLDLDVFSIDTIPLAAKFVEQIKPTWKQGVFVAIKNLEDEVAISEDLEMSATLHLEDTPCDAAIVLYDGADYATSSADYDWIYDQGQTAWDATSAGMRGTALELSGTLSLTTGSPIGTAGTDAGGGAAALIAEVSPNDYLALGLYLEGAAGITTAGSHTFTELGVGGLTGMEVGDRIFITGEGTFTVLSVDVVAGTLLIDGPLTLDSLNVVWYSTGPFSVWAQVDSVDGSGTFLTFKTNYPSADAVYKMAKLNLLYRQAVYDQYEEACPNETFELRITLDTAATGPKLVPQPDGSVAPYNFTVMGETYSVTLIEPDEAP